MPQTSLAKKEATITKAGAKKAKNVAGTTTKSKVGGKKTAATTKTETKSKKRHCGGGDEDDKLQAIIIKMGKTQPETNAGRKMYWDKLKDIIIYIKRSKTNDPFLVEFNGDYLNMINIVNKMNSFITNNFLIDYESLDKKITHEQLRGNKPWDFSNPNVPEVIKKHAVSKGIVQDMFSVGQEFNSACRKQPAIAHAIMHDGQIYNILASFNKYYTRVFPGRSIYMFPANTSPRGW